MTKKNELAKSSILFGNAPLLTNRPYHQAEGIREIADEFEVNIAAGFVGCFGKITIDGISVPKTSQGLRLYNAIIGCDSAAMSPCLQAPCRNGGQCIPPNKLSDDEASDVPSPHPFICKCLSRYTGVQCEIDCKHFLLWLWYDCTNLHTDVHLNVMIWYIECIECISIIIINKLIVLYLSLKPLYLFKVLIISW